MDNSCPDCGCSDIITDTKTGERVCSKCGLVVEDYQVDNRHEWRSLDHDEIAKKVRTGAPSTYLIHDKGLSTEVGWSQKDKRSLSGSQRAQYYRLMKWQKRLDSSAQTLATGLSKIDRVASHLHLPKNVKEGASLLYRKVVEKNMIKGRSIDSIVSACLYILCRQFHMSRTLDEITNAAHTERIEVGKVYRVLLREFKIKLTPPDPLEYVPRFASALSLSEEIQVQAETILRELMDANIKCGRNPVAIAAAALYIASTISGESRTQREVSKVANTSEVTLRNRCRELYDKLRAHPILGKDISSLFPE